VAEKAIAGTWQTETEVMKSWSPIVAHCYTSPDVNFCFPDWVAQTEFVQGANTFFAILSLNFLLIFQRCRNFPPVAFLEWGIVWAAGKLFWYRQRDFLSLISEFSYGKLKQKGFFHSVGLNRNGWKK
jgi:hypothetical protein